MSGHFIISRHPTFSFTSLISVKVLISKLYPNSFALEAKSFWSPIQTTFAFINLKKSSFKRLKNRSGPMPAGSPGE